MRPHLRPLLALAPLLGLALAARSLPQFALPTAWPVERMVTNLERTANENPDDAQAHYELGRVHALAFTLEANELGMWMTDPPRPLAAHQQSAHYGRAKKPGDTPSPETLRRHVDQGLTHLQRAVSLAPERAEIHLSLAHLVEHAAHLAADFDTQRLFQLPQIRLRREVGEAIQRNLEALGADKKSTRRRAMKELQSREQFLPALERLHREVASSNRHRSDSARELLRRFWIEQAIHHYRLATDLSLPIDLQLEARPMAYIDGNSLSQLASYEAGRAWIRLVEERDPVDDREKQALVSTKAAIEKLEDLPPPNMITPLVVSFTPHQRLADLLLPDHAVLFDLDGNGVEEAWPWVRPETAFLVWDPEHEGRITDARQLFGTASAQLLFGDGYRALAALDDDGDGWVSGDELTGVALWFDRDSDGYCDPGEVAPAREHGIAGLATSAAATEGPSLVSPCGVRLEDGRVLPSYDWVTAPVRELP